MFDTEEPKATPGAGTKTAAGVPEDGFDTETRRQAIDIVVRLIEADLSSGRPNTSISYQIERFGLYVNQVSAVLDGD